MLRLLKTSAFQSTRSPALYFHSATLFRMASNSKSTEWVQPSKGDDPVLKVYNSLTKSKVRSNLVSSITLLMLAIRRISFLKRVGM